MTRKMCGAGITLWSVRWLFLWIACVYVCDAVPTNYIIGTGIADVTGPAAEVNMMGYANPSQTTHGIHIRQYSRAFIVTDSGDKARVVFVSVDACMISQILTIKVMARLKELYPGLYNETNVCLSGIHTHSGPGGFHQYVLLDVTSLGFVEQSLDSLVDGVVKSIQRAHGNMKPGNIYLNEGELLDSNINRSPTAYQNNTAAEKAKYKYNVDKNMTVVKFLDANNKGIGMLSWFAVHCTSMNNTNPLISGDNKGYASQLFEAKMNNGSLPGHGPFIAAFAQSNLGDVSPNTKGPHCLDSGKPCDPATSTCLGKNELCVAAGPGKDMFDSTKIIGENQFNKAWDLYTNAEIPVRGPVDFIHQYVNMTNVTVKINESYTAHTCKPAMGYSFAAGTTDGPGMFNFKQGTTTDNVFWDLIRDLLHEPSQELKDCHHPKPILLDTGEIDTPYLWQPQIVATQILRVGQLAVIAVPGEFTTMSGRRTRDAVRQALINGGFPSSTTAVIAGLSNTYADYITTYEEYQVQRYEGGSTIYGPHTLQAYINQFVKLAGAMAKGTALPPGPSPPDLSSVQKSFLLPVIFDGVLSGKTFGDVLRNVTVKYMQSESVHVTFVSANPRNNLMTEKSFLTVDKQDSAGKWSTAFTDSNWETTFRWTRTSTLMGESEAGITWDIPAKQTTGSYRICHFGNSKALFSGAITPFSGCTVTFKVVAKDRYSHRDINRTKYRWVHRIAARLQRRKKLRVYFQKNVNGHL